MIQLQKIFRTYHLLVIHWNANNVPFIHTKFNNCKIPMNCYCLPKINKLRNVRWSFLVLRKNLWWYRNEVSNNLRKIRNWELILREKTFNKLTRKKKRMKWWSIWKTGKFCWWNKLKICRIRCSSVS